MEVGRVRYWQPEKQFGFIDPRYGGEGVWFCVGSLCNPGEIQHIRVGQRVEYLLAANERGPCSRHVRLVPASDDSSEAL